MPLTNDMLAAFVKVADTHSVSAAALALGVGKGLVSKRIAQLEAAVGATLFARSTRRLALTPAGDAYLVGARGALHELATAQERLRELRVQLSGEIRLTAPVSWGQRVLAKRLPDFLQLHAAIHIDLELSDRLMDVAHERVDIALRWSTATARQGLATVAVAEVSWLMAASPAYLETMGCPQHPADLAGHPCLCYWRESGDDRWLLAPAAGGSNCSVQVGSRYHVNNPDAVADAALAGLGIALLPGYLCTGALAEGRLVRVLPEWVPQTKFGQRIMAVAAPERMALARNQALLHFLQHALA